MKIFLVLFLMVFGMDSAFSDETAQPTPTTNNNVTTDNNTGVKEGNAERDLARKRRKKKKHRKHRRHH